MKPAFSFVDFYLFLSFFSLLLSVYLMSVCVLSVFAYASLFSPHDVIQSIFLISKKSKMKSSTSRTLYLNAMNFHTNVNSKR